VLCHPPGGLGGAPIKIMVPPLYALQGSANFRKSSKNGFHKLKINRDSVNVYIKSSMRNMEEEIYQKESSNKKYLITRKGFNTKKRKN
jgi:hypothetical protein